MKKKLLLIPLALLLAISLVATGCPAPAVAPPTPVMEPQKWDLTIDSGHLYAPSDVELAAAFDRVKERTGGLLDVRVVPHGALPIKGEEWARAVSAGDLAMSLIFGGYHAGDYPILGIFTVPYLYGNKVEKRKVWEAARPIFRREMEKENIYLLAYQPRFMQHLATSEPVDVMNLKGKLIRSYAEHISMMIEAMGGTPVPVAWPEVYTALATGVADGLLTGSDAILSEKMYEVAPYHYDIGYLHGIFLIAVNKGLWDALPWEVKTIVREELAAFEGLALSQEIMLMETIFEELLAAGSKGFEKITDPAFFTMMREKVSKPLMAIQLERTGAVGEEIVTAIEQVLGVTLR